MHEHIAAVGVVKDEIGKRPTNVDAYKSQEPLRWVKEFLFALRTLTSGPPTVKASWCRKARHARRQTHRSMRGRAETDHEVMVPALEQLRPVAANRPRKSRLEHLEVLIHDRRERR